MGWESTSAPGRASAQPRLVVPAPQPLEDREAPWSGFGAGDRAGSLSRVSAPAEGSESELIAGLALLALGLAGLGGGIAAARRRRRAAAR